MTGALDDVAGATDDEGGADAADELVTGALLLPVVFVGAVLRTVELGAVTVVGTDGAGVVLVVNGALGAGALLLGAVTTGSASVR